MQRDYRDFRVWLQLRETLRVEAISFGTGRWRSQDDLVDSAYDRTVDCVLLNARCGAGGVLAFAKAVLRNLARKGPGRVELARGRVHRLSDDDAGRRAISATMPRCHVPLDRLLQQRPHRLTKAELRAVQAARQANTLREAAVQAHMSRRDFRVRFSRAKEKLRHAAAAFSRTAV